MIGLIMGDTNLSVTLITSLSPELPRIRTSLSSVEYTAQGAVAGSGSYYEPKHLWNFSFIIDIEQMKMLKAIYAEHEYRRRRLLDADVIVEDLSELYEERAPRSRALAANAPAIETIPPDHILYYARFKAWFTQEPRFAKPYKNPLIWTVEFTMTETARVAP